MKYAYSITARKKIEASDADYGKFICLECKRSVGLRKTYKGRKLYHFYHTGRLKDAKCKLSYYEDNWKAHGNLPKERVKQTTDG